MSTDAPPRPRIQKGTRIFQIVASQFNGQYVQGLVAHTLDELHELVPGAAISIHRVPGSFEIPIVVRELARGKQADAIIACGVIMRGETNHAKNLSRSVTDALQRIAIDYGVPVINVVLSFNNKRQARDRCIKDSINRGTEAARAAVEIASTMSKLRGG